MNKYNLTIDVERINLENEKHIRNFLYQLKNLAQHCVNFINSLADKTDCNNKRFLREIHDDDDTTFESQYIIPSLENKNDKIEQNLKGNKEIKQRESIIDSNDPNYLLYSNIALGVPQNVKESYKLLKNKTKIKKKNKDVKSPDNDRKVEFLRTFDEENE